MFHLAHSCPRQTRQTPFHGRLAKLNGNKTYAPNTRELKGMPLFYMQCKLTLVIAYSAELKTKTQAEVMQSFFTKRLFSVKNSNGC